MTLKGFCWDCPAYDDGEGVCHLYPPTVNETDNGIWYNQPTIQVAKKDWCIQGRRLMAEMTEEEQSDLNLTRSVDELLHQEILEDS